MPQASRDTIRFRGNGEVQQTLSSFVFIDTHNPLFNRYFGDQYLAFKMPEWFKESSPSK